MFSDNLRAPDPSLSHMQNLHNPMSLSLLHMQNLHNRMSLYKEVSGSQTTSDMDSYRGLHE